MVVKTELCNFSELKIYPGKGLRIITRDGKLIILSSKKAKAFFLRKTKGQVIRWTVIWRRINKKMKTDTTAKRRRKKAKQIVKGISGLDKEEVRRKMERTNEDVVAQREKFVREMKERKK